MRLLRRIMSFLKPDMIELHRVDNGEIIFVRGSSITLIELADFTDASQGTLVYLGHDDRIRLVKEHPELVQRLVERAE